MLNVNNLTGFGVGVSSAPAAYATWNPLDKYSSIELSNGNLTLRSTVNYGWVAARSTVGVASGKYYWEVTRSGAGVYIAAGISTATGNLSILSSGSSGTAANECDNGQWYVGLGTATPGTTSSIWTTGILGVALDVDGGTCKLYKDNVLQPNYIAFTPNTLI